MPISMEHAIRIAVTATQTEGTRNVREKVPSRASGVKVAQSQNNNNNRGREKSLRGYNKDRGMVQGSGPRDQQFSGRGDNVTPGGDNAHTFGTSWQEGG